MESAVSRIRIKTQAVNKTLQPFPLVVDGEDQLFLSYVIIDAMRFRVESPFEAVDLCFKCLQALHVDYPVQSQGPWLLLQRAIYKIKTLYDATISRVDELCLAFESLSSSTAAA